MTAIQGEMILQIRCPSACAFFMLASCPAFAQASGTLVKEIIQHWEKTKALALEFAEAVPENQYSATASVQPDSIAGALNGIALSNVLACTMALQTRAPGRFQSAFDKPMDSSKAGVTENLTEAFGYCIEGLNRMSDADVFQMAVFKRRRAARFDIFWEAYARSTFMLGQASMLMRSKGLSPPEVGPSYDF
jgi:hypothetical protein